MKKRMIKLTAILLCGAMLAACGGKQDAEKASSAVSASSAAASSSESAESVSEGAEEENTASVSEEAAGENATEVSEEAAGENATEVSEEAAGENATEVSEEAAGENTTEVSEEAAGENTTEVSEEAAGENATEVSEEAAGGNTTEVSEESGTSEVKKSGVTDEMVNETMRNPIMDIPTVEGEYKIEDCIKLGDYKGLNLDMKIDEVTDEDIDTQLSFLLQPVEIEDETAELKEGDTANLDFTGYLDGEAFDGGAATDYDLEIGSGSFIPGFEEQMIGMKKGEERDLDLTFPEEYGSEELAGQEVVFHVKLNAIKVMPEMDDAWAKEISNGECETLEEYRETTRKDLEEQNRAYAEMDLQNEAWNQVADSSEVLAFPEVLLQEKRDEFNSYLESEAQMYGLTVADYIKQMGMTQEDFEKITEEQVRMGVKDELLMDAVVEAEGITEEDPDYQEELKRLEEDYEMTEDELKENYGEDVLKKHLLSKAAGKKILSYAEITETTEPRE